MKHLHIPTPRWFPPLPPLPLTRAMAFCVCGYVIYLALRTYFYFLAGNVLLGIGTGVLHLLASVCLVLAIVTWPRSTIRQPPGAVLASFASFVWPKKSYVRVFEPIISDMRLEYEEALHHGRPAHARWIWVRGVVQFWLAVVMHCVGLVVRVVRSIWTASS